MNVKATGTYYNVSATTPISISTKLVDSSSRTFNFEFVYSDPGGEYPIPSGTQISFDALTYVVQAMHQGNVTLFASQGIAIDWLVSDTFSFLFNAAMALGEMADYYVVAPHTIEYYIVGFDSEWITYRFMYLGVWVDITLTPSGDFTYTTENGRQEHVSNIRHHSATEDLIGKAIQDQLDPTAQKINTPFIGLKSFGDLKLPFIDGKELHFYTVRSGVETEYVIDDFRNVILAGMTSTPTSGFQLMFFFPIDGRTTTINLLSSNNIVASTSLNSNSLIYTGSHKYVFGNNNITVLRYGFYRFGGYDQSNLSFNLPMYYSNINTSIPDQSYISNPNYLGWYNNSLVNGIGDIWLQSITYSNIPTEYRPEVPLELPIPTDQIIIYPETELPEQPDGTPIQPDPFIPEEPINIPGIPINPIPIPLPPFPTIVSGNDDLWGQTIELEGLENSLLPYLGSLAEFDFPSFSDLLTEYTGSIIWVAQIMSLLYNGTPLNILFIVLCLFSLVSILIGAYKLWSSTEPDPKNGGRRYKRPPKGGKKH